MSKQTAAVAVVVGIVVRLQMTEKRYLLLRATTSSISQCTNAISNIGKAIAPSWLTYAYYTSRPSYTCTHIHYVCGSTPGIKSWEKWVRAHLSYMCASFFLLRVHMFEMPLIATQIRVKVIQTTYFDINKPNVGRLHYIIKRKMSLKTIRRIKSDTLCHMWAI